MDTSSKFRQALSLWLASHGMTEEQCETVLTHRRMALCLRMQDPGGVVQDIPTVLSGVQGGREAYSASISAAGQFELLQLLRNSGRTAVARPKPSVPKQKTVKAHELTLLNKDDSWRIVLGSELRSLTKEQAQFVAARGSVRSCVLWLRDNTNFQVNLVRGALSDVFRELERQHQLRRMPDLKVDVQQTERVPGSDERANHFELVFVLDAGAYLQFFDKLSAVAA